MNDTPEPARKARPISRPLEAVACIGLLVAWASCLIFVPLGVPLLAIAIIWFSVRREWVKAAAFVVASPFALVPLYACLSAALALATGRAEILTWGYPAYEQGAPDDRTYLPMRSTGCVLTGFEVLYNEPNNGTLRLLTRLFGDNRKDYWNGKDSHRHCGIAIRGYPRRSPPPCDAMHMCANEVTLDPAARETLLTMIRATPGCAAP